MRKVTRKKSSQGYDQIEYLYECPECKKLFKETKYLDDHLKRACKMNIHYNNYRDNNHI